MVFSCLFAIDSLAALTGTVLFLWGLTNGSVHPGNVNGNLFCLGFIFVVLLLARLVRSAGRTITANVVLAFPALPIVVFSGLFVADLVRKL
jgi:hypothetical protein